MKIRSEFLSFNPPCIGEEEIAEVTDTLRSSWITSGPKTKKFEEEFCKTVNAEAAVAVNSCTAGLHLSLLVHGVGPGVEVITTPLTFCATANVVEHLGGRVVLADTKPGEFLIDAREVEKKITKNTKVLLPVHYAGEPVDLDPIDELARKHKLAVVEDAAHSLPATYKGKYIGSRSSLANFSFYATKNVTTAEGGMITGSKELIERIRPLALHGLSRDAWKRFDKSGNWRYDVEAPGYKYNMTDIASSLGLVQLRRLKEMQTRRHEIWKLYEEAFGSLKEVEIPRLNKHGESSLHLYVLRLNLDTLKVNRDRFFDELKELNIGCSIHYIPIHLFSYYAKKYSWTPKDFPNATNTFDRMISIPFHPKLSDSDVSDVINAVQFLCKKHRR